MQSYTVSQLFSLPLNTVVPSVSATISQLGPYKTGVNEYGDWSIQMGRLTDGVQTAEFKLFDHVQLPPTLTGQSVTLLCGQGKSGPAGLTWKQEVRNWQPGQPVKVFLECKAKSGAKVNSVGGSPAPQMASQAFPQPVPQQQAPPQSPPQPPPQKTTTAAKLFVGRNRSLASLSLVALMRTVKEVETRYGTFPPELWAPVFNTLLYGASNAGIPDSLPPGLGIDHFETAHPRPATDPQAQAPQVALEALVMGAGYTFNTLQRWGEESGTIPEASSLSGFGDVPDEVALKLVRAGELVIQGLQAVNPFPA